MSKRHHFLPQLYLRRFASKPKRIHVYNLKRGVLIRDASLRDQCYKRRFHVDQELEDRFSTLESDFTPVLDSIVGSGEPPEAKSSEHGQTLAFVALQMLRTLGAIKTVGQAFRGFDEAAFGQDGPGRPDPAGHERILAISLSQVPRVMEGFADLGMHLAVSSGQPFITSDNPVYKYNMFCEGITWSGVTGARCSGLQIFVPLGPSHVLILFDEQIYKAGVRSGSRTSSASDADIESLNMLQAISAHRNLYSNAADESRIRAAAAAGRRFRGSKRPVTIESVSDEDPNDGLIHQYERLPNLGLTLSFMSVRRRARRIQLADRGRMFRDGSHSRFGLVERPRPGSSRRFTVRREI